MTEDFILDFIACETQLRKPPFDPSTKRDNYVRNLMTSDAESAFFLLKSESTLLGRLAVFKSATYPKDAAVGLFEIDLDHDFTSHAAVLLNAAAEWAKTNGAIRLLGPMDKNTWYQYRFRVDPEVSHQSWEPAQPLEYAACWRAFGFQTLERYKSFFFRNYPLLAMRLAVGLFFYPAYRRATRTGFSFGPFSRSWSENLPDIYAIGIDSFAANFHFEKISRADFDQLYLGMPVDTSLSVFLIDPNGKPAGFFLSYLSNGYQVGKTLGLRPDLQGLGLGKALLYASMTKAIERRCNSCVGALVKVGNRTEAIARKLQRFGLLSEVHNYELFSYTIE